MHNIKLYSVGEHLIYKIVLVIVNYTIIFTSMNRQTKIILMRCKKIWTHLGKTTAQGNGLKIKLNSDMIALVL